jgi:hypothetical protein
VSGDTSKYWRITKGLFVDLETIRMKWKGVETETGLIGEINCVEKGSGVKWKGDGVRGVFRGVLSTQ